MSASAPVNAETSRKARRDWIDKNGDVTDEEAQATGFRYTHIPTAKRIRADFDPETELADAQAFFEMREIPEPTKTMLAIFGGLTLVGNIVSTETNPKSKGDPDANPIPAVVDRFAEMANGIWAGERGSGGPRYNAQALAQAIAKVKGDPDHNVYLAKIENKEKVTIKGKGSILYAAYAMKNKDVEREYNILAGIEPVTVTASDL